MLSHVLVCSTCLSFYRHPPIRIQVYRIASYYITQRLKRWIDTFLQILMSILMTIKSFIYFGLTVLLIFMNSQLELLHEQVLALLQIDGELRLAVVANSPSSLLAQIGPGMILTASDKMSSDPLFASSQILIFERTDKRVRGVVLNRSTDTRLLDAVGGANGAEYAGSVGGPVQISPRVFIVSNDRESFASLHPSYIKKIYEIPVLDIDVHTANDAGTIFIAECHRLVDIGPTSTLNAKLRLVRGCVYSWSPCFLVGDIAASLWTTRVLQFTDVRDVLLSHSIS